MHQAYFTLKNLLEIPVYVQAGRFEMKYGTERFFGLGGWSYIGRAFDGLRMGYKGKMDIDLFAITHTETLPYLTNAFAANYPFDGLMNKSSIPGIYGLFHKYTCPY